MSSNEAPSHKRGREVHLRPPDIIYRTDWGALPPKDEEILSLPASDVLFTFTSTEECHTGEECVKALQALQRRDMDERGLPDIQYNFLIGGDTKVYEGRGWHVTATKDPRHAALNGKSIDIAYIGDFKDKFPSEEVISAGGDLLKYLLEHGYVKEDFFLTPLGKSQIEEDGDPNTQDTEEPTVKYYGAVKEEDDILGDD